MKRTSTLTLAALFMAGPLLAQPILDSADVDPVGLTFIIYGVTGAGSSNYLDDGANITWDFSTASTILGGSAAFIPAALAGAPAAQYPDANMAFEYNVLGNTTYSFGTLSAASLEFLSEQVFPDPETVYIDPRTALEFPYAYQDVFIDTYQAVGGPAKTAARQYTGYGTVITPFDTILDVVKQTSTDSTLVFWNSSPLYSIVTVATAGTVFLVPTNVGMLEGPEQVTLAVFPNPASTILEIRGAEEMDTWMVIDAMGRQVMNGGVQRSQRLTVDIDHLAPGSYQLIASSDMRVGRHAFVVAR